MPERVTQIEISADTMVMIEGLVKIAKEKACEIEWINGLISGLIIKQLGSVDTDRISNLHDEILDVLYGTSTSIEEVFKKPWVNIAVHGGSFDANP